ncbi:MAG: hypothetical protein OXS29_09740 [bacterium]|nr:hypothetical protein [bacterium]MDE0289825.1 hypothetical protein [bacterium]MDE0438043.1 hypothetical protein [bacterium]
MSEKRGNSTLGTHTARISELELGRNHNHHLATQYQDWLHTHEAAPPI